ncbi:protein NRT1/ PTR FAMILY 8.1-like [Tripterygium wilfordii]|uniref:Protein NRT1/ PTR FAMILY 8.1-like n=1 Tax=Tripterygium wilfordii TaxID=458696 RepID=A0A7J7DYJ8_TRIWF|nr:protein NRT1/ PTR FAMILY 8.1-like [Tripterygium wilfordii]XP_038680290.1 protein NRT1/ PTR FAMILY 8.1-like [Tripterygium wilfordii]XP_038680296.1 protein NRT1/ PTR FAMILY 8.1-like [Tripterygium wilfordii]KAF5751397.1 protein NRT1/ PTR FAMILY 8.1-like [Tripterygium wilfordii]
MGSIPTTAMEEDDNYTKDGTVDYLGNRADKNKTGTWKACPYIIGNECCERLAYYGMSSNLVTYFKYRLNQHSATATRSNLNWSGTCYITPLIGAFLADAYLGRYWTIACFSIVYVFGMTLLTMSASVPGLRPTCYADDKCHASETQTAVCFVALYIIALGTGGIKPCVSSYGADQFDDTDETEKQHKSSFFNWFYLSINVGALIAGSVLVWVQENVSWGWGFGIPAMAMGIAVVTFFWGSKLYRNQNPGGSPITRLSQVLVASFRKYQVQVPADKSLLYETAEAESNIQGSRKLDHTEDLRFFDKAAVDTRTDQVKDSVDPWTLSTVTQVEELKSIIRLLPIWATGIIFSAAYSQMGSLFVLQGQTMDTRFGKSNFKIPAASLSIFDTLSVIFWVPVYDRIIVPIARKFTREKNGITTLQRMGIGLFISIFSMIAAAILEVERLKMVKRDNYYARDWIPMSIFWQIPQYFLIGCAEVFTFIGQLEFFYEQAPDAMRSMCSALSLTTGALGSYLSSLLVTIVTSVSTKNGKVGWIPDNLNYGRLHYFFWLLAVMSVLNLGAFLLIAKRYTYKKAVGTLS